MGVQPTMRLKYNAMYNEDGKLKLDIFIPDGHLNEKR